MLTICQHYSHSYSLNFISRGWDVSGHYYNSFYHTNSYLVLLGIYSMIKLQIKRLRLLLGQAVNYNSNTYNPQTCVSNIRHASQPFSNLFQPPTTLRHTSQPLWPQQPVSTTYNPQTCVSNPRHTSRPFSNLFQPSTTILTPHTTPRHMFQAPDMHLNPSATFFDAPNPFLHPRSQNARTIVHVFLHIYIL